MDENNPGQLLARLTQMQASVERQEREAAENVRALRSYSGILDGDNMTSSRDLAARFDSAQDYEDSFL